MSVIKNGFKVGPDNRKHYIICRHSRVNEELCIPPYPDGPVSMPGVPPPHDRGCGGTHKIGGVRGYLMLQAVNKRGRSVKSKITIYNNCFESASFKMVLNYGDCSNEFNCWTIEAREVEVVKNPGGGTDEVDVNVEIGPRTP